MQHRVGIREKGEAAGVKNGERMCQAAMCSEDHVRGGQETFQTDGFLQ